MKSAVEVVPAPAEECDGWVAVPVGNPCSLPSVTPQGTRPVGSVTPQVTRPISYGVGSVSRESSDSEPEDHFENEDSQELSSPRSQDSVVPCPRQDFPEAAGRCQSMKQVRRFSNRALVANAGRPMISLSDFSQESDSRCSFVVSGFMASASAVLHLPIGLVQGGCPDHRAKVLLISAKLVSAGFCALCGYSSYMTVGYEKWSHTLYALEAVVFFLLLATVSSSDDFRELMQERIPEMQKTLGSRLQTSLKFDLLPIGVYLVICLLCFVFLVQLHPGSIAHPFPISLALQRLGWAFVLLRLNRSMVILLDRFAVAYAQRPADFQIAYEEWAYIAALAGEISRWTGAAYLHLSTFALLGMFPLIAEVLLGLQDNTDWLLSHLFVNLTNCCLALHVLHGAAVVSHQKDSAVASVNSLQWKLTWQQRHRQHLFVAYMGQSEVGTYVYGSRVTNALLAKLVPVLVTGGSFALARVLALPQERQAKLVQQWSHLLQALGVQ